MILDRYWSAEAEEGQWPLEGAEGHLTRPGEPIGSYIRRLARANHLKPSYLHGFLTGSTNWFGKPQLERFAALTERSPDVLQRVLADAEARRRRRKPLPHRPSAVDPLQPLIDSMIEVGHSPTQIWVQLMDEHDTSIYYGIIRRYVHDHTLMDWRQQTPVSTNRVRPGQRPPSD